MDFPAEFRKRMETILGDRMADLHTAYELPLRRGVRVNTQKISAERFLSLFPHRLEPSPFAPECFYLDETHKAGTDPLHHAGAYYMQEPSASSAVTVLAPKPGEKILDLCAAPGGKSSQIGALLQGKGLLWSNEYVSARGKILEQNLERMGVRNRVISVGDTAKVCDRLPGFFDGVLVDAPCSGEGMFRKEPQALELWSMENILLCSRRQKEILENACRAVKPGGRLVYSTCTFAPEENELVIADFLANHPDFTVEKISVPWGSPGLDADTLNAFGESHGYDLTGCRRIFPFDGGEGHFVALLKRADTAVSEAVKPFAFPAKNINHSAALALYRDCFIDEAIGDFVTMGDFVWLIPPDMPDAKGIHVLSAGIPVAEVCKNRLEPCHGSFLAARSENCRTAVNFSADDPRLLAYLHGEELVLSEEAASDTAWTAVAVESIPVGFGKLVNGKLKNRYPKGLRLL